MTRAPDLVAPVIAFRSWRVVDGELVSPYLPELWEDGVAAAHCHAGAREGSEPLPFEHRSPHPRCRCGIHAYFEARSALPTVDFRRVLGIVAVWGRLEVHADGVRAEFARVQALGAAPDWTTWHRADVTEIAARLGVPLVDEDVLAAAAGEYGSPIPASFREAGA